MRGQGKVYKHGNIWWLDYSIRGHQYRETSKSTSYRDALKLLIMALCGWRSRSVFERYNIVRPEDVKDGIARRFNSTLPAQSASPETEPDHVS
jgi:hypothetical protein